MFINSEGSLRLVFLFLLGLLTDQHLDFTADNELVLFSQYRASAHLWCRLHAHYKGDMNQDSIIAEHADQASSILKKLLGDLARSEPRKSTSQSPPKKSAPKKGGPSGRKVTVGSRARVARKVTVKEPVTPKPKARAGRRSNVDLQDIC